MFLEEGLLTFDLFAPKALALLRGSLALRQLVASRFPLIIVDEAQDTGSDQWSCIAELAQFVQLICLADLDQQIYDFRPDVSPDRIKHIMQALRPLDVALGAQNNRSPGSEIVKFGNDVLAGTPRGSAYKGISQFSFQPKANKRNAAIRGAIGILHRKISAATGSPPKSIGYLTPWGNGVAIVARALEGSDNDKPIPHRLVTEEGDMLLATRVIALCLEPIDDPWSTLGTGLDLVAEFYKGRGNGQKAAQLSAGAAMARQGRTKGTAKCPKGLRVIVEGLKVQRLSGSPVADWATIRRQFESSGVKELEDVARAVGYLMAFNRGRKISDALAETWQRQGNYRRARALIEAAISEDQLMGSDGGLAGINVMTIHKSKGKEFDGVVVADFGSNLSPFCPRGDPAPHAKSRRLLRVGITRARHHVVVLTDVSSPSPILAGHRLGS